MKTYDHQIPDPPVAWWMFPFIVGGCVGLLCSLTVRMQSAEYGAKMQRACEVHCASSGMGHGTAEPAADACVCDQGGSQP